MSLVRYSPIASVAALLVIAGCDQGTAPVTYDRTVPHAGLVEPPAHVAPAQYDCLGSAVPSCPPGHTGSLCDLECIEGSVDCSLHYYCHADGRVLGLGASGTYLFLHSSPNPSPAQVRAGLETWIAAHESDLGLPAGLNPNLLDIEVTNGSEASQGLLQIYRFHQYHDAGSNRALVVGDGSTITVELNAVGALAVKGTIVDPRTPFAHSSSQASSTIAAASIRRHVSQHLGILVSEVAVGSPGLVAVPGADVIGWQATATLNGQVTVATVIVEADPNWPGSLPLVQYQDHTVNGLANTVSIDVVSEDFGSNVNSPPISEASVSTLFNGSDLLGSTDNVSTDPQLATEEVVTLDLHAGQLGSVMGPADFDRFTDAAGSFGGTQPSLEFDAQRYHHLAMEAYALVDYVTVGGWDSALPRFIETIPDPMNPMGTIEVPFSTDYPPGQFRPRIINATNHAPLGGPSGQATYGRISGPTPILELLQEPMPGQEGEVIAYINLPAGSSPANVFLHELGHAFDVFLAPGFAGDFIPICTSGCDSVCNEDTSDEALPLTETIAQMFALWQYQRAVGIAHDDCGIISAVMTGAGQGSTLVHHPNCMGPTDEISMFIRPDDPSCTDPDFCDKPSQNEVDPPYACNATEGYNVTSLLQVWWNALHGQYCEPSDPFPCSAVLDVAWPPGCDAPGSMVACATPDEVAGLALVYAVRTNPMSYEDFLDSMATFVACNYGSDAYTDFNEALCDHQLRDCDEPVPTSCESCGNGLREGSEQCDGLDLSVPELGVVPTCLDFGYANGTLVCDASCNYDFGQCVSGEADSTGSSDSASSSDTAQGSGSAGTAGGGGGGGGGCGCSTDGRSNDFSPWLVAPLLGLWPRTRRKRVHSRARRRWFSTARLLGAVAFATSIVGCGPDVGGEGSAGAASSSTTASEGSDSTSSTDGLIWPEDSLGAFYIENTIPLGIVANYIAALSNLELTREGLVVTHLGCDGDELREEFSVDYQGAEAHVRPRPGDSQVMWRGGPMAAELIVRPGPTCDTLELEIIEPFPGYPSQWRWFRGALFITDTCGPSDYEWAVDLRPDVPTECPSSG